MSLKVQSNTMIRQTTPTGINMVVQSNTPTGPKTPVLGLSGISQSDTPNKRLMHSPLSGLISPNDDETERARARAARAAQRRRPFGSQLDAVGTGQSTAASQEESNILSQESLQAILQNCLKLSNANKINQGNTWDLKLIDHLSDLVRNDVDDNAQTNFQLASCTLETGVKIYSYRVDSVHSEAYKLLGGLGRSAHEQPTTELPSEDGDGRGSNATPGPTTSKKAGSTLVASDEALNANKIDVAFNVDPLFHQTSAMFDDGGAKGLLLHNLCAYSGCEIVFDSFEVPEKKMRTQASVGEEGSDTLDLSFMKDTLERMMDVLRQGPEITPALKEIVKLIDDPRRAEFEAEGGQALESSRTPELVTPTRSWSDTADFDGAQDDDPGEIFDHVDNGFDNMHAAGSFSGGTSPDSQSWSDANGDQEDIDGGEDGSSDVFMSQDPLEWLAMSTGMPIRSNDWAGPDHWKYAKKKEDPNSAPADTGVKDKTKRKKKEVFSIDYGNNEGIDLSAFLPPKNPRSLLRPQSIIPINTLLPEDYHYEAADLAKFSLRPAVWVFRRRSKQRSKHVGDMGNEARWGDDADDLLGEWGDDAGHSDVEDPPDAELIPQPRKVQKISVTYDKYAKQVDVRLLKQTLWEQVQHGSSEDDHQESDLNKENGLSFRGVLQRFPDDCPAAAPADISVHLCFICLLHLANEHCLRIDDCSTMDDLRIFCD